MYQQSSHEENMNAENTQTIELSLLHLEKLKDG